MKAAEIKKFFKEKFGIPVRVRTVAVKDPFVQVWIESEGAGHEQPRYNHQFPEVVDTALLKAIYGENTTITFPAGNATLHSLSMHAHEWEAVKAAVA